MSDETTPATDDPAAADDGATTDVEPAAPAAVSGLQRTTHGQTLFDRFVSPVLLPMGAVAMIIFVVANLSRVFLAGTGGGHSDEGAEAASHGHPVLPVVIAGIVTVLILVFATSFAAAKKMRSHTLAVFSVVALGTVLFAGWLSVGDAQEKVAAETAVECEPAENQLEIVGFNSLKFDKTEYAVPAGCLELTFGGDGGHTLVFSSPPPSPFPKFDGPGASATYAVEAGEYTVFCDVPGHRAGGMVATLIVEEAA